MPGIWTFLGALGGIVLVWKGAVYSWDAARKKYYDRIANSSDYYFKYLECAEIFLEDGKSFTMYVSVVLVSRVNRLDGITSRWEPASTTRWSATPIEGDIEIRDVSTEDPTGDWKKYWIDFPRPLSKGDSISYTMRLDLEETEPSNGSSRVTWTTTRRIDKLILRAVFEEEMDESFERKVHNFDGDLVESSQLDYDIVTNEVKTVFKNARPNQKYSIIW